VWGNNYPQPTKTDYSAWNTLKGNKKQLAGTFAKVGLFGYDI
jgi:hypothetical protein